MSTQAGKAKVGGSVISYEATVDDVVVAASSGSSTARYVYISYRRTDVDDPRRPVVFAFNGGPGSSSVWLHLGLGPRRPADADLLEPRTVPPFALVDNQDSLLDVADLVFIDPPGTGFSRVLGDDDDGAFYAVGPDAIATLRFIAEWTRRNGREPAPKFLMGESYGAIRAATMAKLSSGGPTYTGSLDAQGITGIILLGPGFSIGGSGDDIRAANALESLAATAWYHRRLPAPSADLLAHVAAAREFAGAEYLAALYAGERLGRSTRDGVAEQVAALIGVSAEVVRQHDLRPSTAAFAEALLADRGLQIGLYDSRYTLPLRPAGHDPVADDPAMGQYVAAFAGSITQYLRGDLQASYDEEYRSIEFAKVNSRWDWKAETDQPSGVNYAIDLAVAMRRNRHLEVLVGCGLYDLVATAGSTEYALSHAPLDPDRVRVHRYESGHMPYLGAQSRQRVAADLRQFVLRQSAA